MEDIKDVQIWSAKQIVENIPMTMAELIKMETNWRILILMSSEIKFSFTILRAMNWCFLFPVINDQPSEFGNDVINNKVGRLHIRCDGHL